MNHDATSPRPQQSDPPGSPPQRASTVSVHAGEARQKLGHSITDPIICASTYTFDDTQAVIDYIEQGHKRGEYGRYGKPGEWVIEEKMAALEGAEEALLYSTGMAAIVGLLMTNLSAGDEVIFFNECYHRSREFCAKHLSRFGVVTHQVPTGDYEAMEAAINAKTRLLVSESPTNPHLSVVDLDRFVDIGKQRGIDTLIDATLATPYNLRPIDYGVDYVAAFGDQVPGRAQRPVGRRHHRRRPRNSKPVRKLRGIMGGDQLAAQHLSAGNAA